MMNIQKKKIIIDNETQKKSTKFVNVSKFVKHMKIFSNHAKQQHYKKIQKKLSWTRSKNSNQQWNVF